MSAFPPVARKALRVIRYDGSSRILMQKEETLSSGYAQSFEDAFRYLMALLPSEERIEGAVRRTGRGVSSNCLTRAYGELADSSGLPGWRRGTHGRGFRRAY